MEQPPVTPNDSNAEVYVRDRRPSQVASGVLLVVLGLIFFADRQGWILGWPISFDRLWPLLLIVIGIGRLIVPTTVVVSSEGQPERVTVRHSLGGGLWLVAAGVLLFLHVNRILRLDQSWPVFIVIGGLALIFGERRPRTRRFRGGRRG